MTNTQSTGGAARTGIRRSLSIATARPGLSPARLAPREHLGEAAIGNRAEERAAREAGPVVAGLERPQRKRASWRGAERAAGCAARAHRAPRRRGPSGGGGAGGSSSAGPSGSGCSDRTAPRGPRRSARRARRLAAVVRDEREHRSSRATSARSRRAKRAPSSVERLVARLGGRSRRVALADVGGLQLDQPLLARATRAPRRRARAARRGRRGLVELERIQMRPACRRERAARRKSPRAPRRSARRCRSTRVVGRKL